MIKGKESLSFEELEGRAAKIDYLPFTMKLGNCKLIESM